jgi:hypothetical protein
VLAMVPICVLLLCVGGGRASQSQYAADAG